jgi:hypothetical protein
MCLFRPRRATEELRGSPFASSCHLVEQVCRDVTAPLEPKAPGHDVACHLVE